MRDRISVTESSHGNAHLNNAMKTRHATPAQVVVPCVNGAICLILYDKLRDAVFARCETSGRFT